VNKNELEIERKFLIKYPELEALEKRAERTDIVQTYLVPEQKGSTERVRMRGRDGEYVCTHTVKFRISDMSRTEIEHEVTRERYEELLTRADGKRAVIRKSRYCLEYRSQLFEIDVFPFWNDRAVMEIELDDEAQQVFFPPEIEIIKEVTADKRYTNASMAIQIPYDEI